MRIGLLGAVLLFLWAFLVLPAIILIVGSCQCVPLLGSLPSAPSVEIANSLFMIILFYVVPVVAVGMIAYWRCCKM
jgi:hypothetical protein